MSTSTEAAKYSTHELGERITGTKEQVQAFGIAIGRAFPGEPNGPKRQLSVRDPRGFLVKITRSYVRPRAFDAYIEYPHAPRRPTPPGTTPFPGVRRVEACWYDEFIGTVDDLIAAGLVSPTHLPGAPGMRKTRVTIMADGSVLAGNYANSIAGAGMAGVTHVERASPRSSTVTVRVHVGREEGLRRNARDEIAHSMWLHEARQLQRPRPLTPSHGDALLRHAGALVDAKVDTTFQALLARISQPITGETS